MEKSIAKARPRAKRKVPEPRAPRQPSISDDPSVEMAACRRFQTQHAKELGGWSALRAIVRLSYRGELYDATMCLFYPPENYAGPSYHTSDPCPETGAREFFKFGVLLEADELPVAVDPTEVRRWSLGFCELPGGDIEVSQAVDNAPVSKDLEVFILDMIYIRPNNGRRAARARPPTEHIRDVIRKKTQQTGYLPDDFPGQPRYGILRSKSTHEAHLRARSLETSDDDFDKALRELMIAPTPWDEAPTANREELEYACTQVHERVQYIEMNESPHVLVSEHMPCSTDDGKTSVWRALYQSQESASIPSAHQERPCVVMMDNARVQHFVVWKVL